MCLKTIIKTTILFACFALQANLYAKDTYKWPHEVYKKEAYPNAKIGILKNGFRYIVVPNKTPEKRVFVELLVETGSLMEKDDTRGIAHFLEHMAFNGTKSFPGNTLIDYFKKIGMSFGGDTNAHTGFDETVYKLNLPDESHIDDGLKIMYDYANNITFDATEIEKERGIILSEKRSRDNPSSRLLQNELHFSLGGTLIPNRFPIGTEECINKVQQKDFLEYYKTYYRPSNMVLFVVGDVNAKDWEKKIKKIFKNAENPKEEITPTQIGKIKHEGLKINYIYEEESSDTKVEIATLFIEKNQPDQKLEDLILNKLAESAASYIINLRLNEKFQKTDSPATKGSSYITDWIYGIKSGSISAHCKSENWEKSLHAIEQEIRSVLTFGVLDSELELFKKDLLSGMEKQVSKMDTRSSGSIIRSAQSAFKDELPFMNDLQKMNLQLPLLQILNKDIIATRLKYFWERNHRIVSITGNLKLDNAKDSIGNAWNESAKVEIKKPEQTASLKFPYLPAPKGSVDPQKDLTIQDLDIKRLVYPNNIVLNLKKTDFKTNEILIKIAFGTGSRSVPEGQENLAHISNVYFNEDGLGKLTKTELQKALTGKSAGLNFHTHPDCFTLSASTTKDDFELQLELMRTFLLDPGYHSETKEQTLKKLDQFYNEVSKNVILYFRYTYANLISAGDPLFELPIEPRIQDFDPAILKKWLDGEFQKGQMEINICGDIELNEATQLISKYFGTMSEKSALKSYERRSLNTPEGNEVSKEFDSAIAKSIIAYQIKTTDFYNIDEVRHLNMLGQVIGEKLMKRVREELSISYSPSARHNFNETYKDNCALQFFADVDIGKEQLFIDELEKILKDITTNGITAEDLQAVIKPTLNHILTTLKTNSYWLDRVMVKSAIDETKLEMARSFKAAYENMKFEDVNRLAKKYIQTEKAFKLIVKSHKQNAVLETK